MINKFLLTKEEFDRSYSKKFIYTEEYEALHELNASDAFAVKFTYPSVNKAQSARTQILKRIVSLKMPLFAMQREANVIVFKKRG